MRNYRRETEIFQALCIVILVVWTILAFLIGGPVSESSP